MAAKDVSGLGTLSAELAFDLLKHVFAATLGGFGLLANANLHALAPGQVGIGSGRFVGIALVLSAF
jgi:hypothetical protein